ncbi:class I SAM-dependent methyltransferase [Methylocapsa polymorpha]|uniref:Class I SAM-dependent methyltransferase n=1 Tax=Methylocapsa polymorpha TaxID=3080828 RepID=A0ABZ0HQE9_9HYPH|nr:class I SAM-dependent methyltransferase [Methylocapsa sp. RX1]
MMHLSPVPSNEDLATHYQQASILHGIGSSDIFLAAINDPVRLDYAQQIIQWICDKAPTTLEFLQSGFCIDVGCNCGWFMNAARERGIRSIGIELDDVLCAYNKEYIGCEMFCGMFEDTPPQFEQSASLIVLNDTLEHHASPLGSLETCYRMTKPGGIVFVNVPNALFWKAQHDIESWEWFESDHLMYFNESSIRKAFEICGFKDIVTDTHDWGNNQIMLSNAGIDPTPQMFEYIYNHRMREKLWCAGRRAE